MEKPRGAVAYTRPLPDGRGSEKQFVPSRDRRERSAVP